MWRSMRNITHLVYNSTGWVGLMQRWLTCLASTAGGRHAWLLESYLNSTVGRCVFRTPSSCVHVAGACTSELVVGYVVHVCYVYPSDRYKTRSRRFALTNGEWRWCLLRGKLRNSEAVKCSSDSFGWLIHDSKLWGANPLTESSRRRAQKRTRVNWLGLP